MQRFCDAAEAYRKSTALKPVDNPAHAELMAMELPENELALEMDPTDIGTRAETIYLDFTDLMIYVQHNNSLSGIQRVVANLLLRAGHYATERGVRIVPVLPNYHHQTMSSVNMQAVVALLEAMDAKRPKEIIEQCLLSVRASKRRVWPRDGDTFVIAGAFWIYQRYDLLNTLRLSGVSVVVYVHDLIQITNPEYVARDATNDFRRSIVDVLGVCSYVLTNSEFVASEVRRFVGERMTFAIPVAAVTLATELGNQRGPSAPPDAKVVALAKRDYALVVSTIEIRKNHAYAISIWENMIAAMPLDEVPDLVFVGKWGWHIEELRRYLDGSDYLKGKLHILTGVSDGELAFLYQHCLLTIYPSFAEGWGLPVGESLGYGKPCVASSVTAIPEVGGDFCRYFDPFDVEDGTKVVTSILKDRASLATWTKRISDDFKPKTWTAFCDEFYASLQTRADQGMERPRHSNQLLFPGEIAQCGGSAILQMDVVGERFVTGRMARIEGWHQNEHWGCWAASPRATLLIFTTLTEPTDVTLHLLLCAPSPETPARCTLAIGNGEAVSIAGLGSVARWAAVSGRCAADGSIAVTLNSIEGFAPGSDGVERFVGLIAFGYAPQADREARERLIEAIVPGALSH